MNRRTICCLAGMLFLLMVLGAAASAVTISGYILDPNWYARHPKLTSPQVYGTGCYEYGVAGNINNSSAPGLWSNTEGYTDNYGWGVFGFFRKLNQTSGTYTLATWDNWWRSTFLFNQTFSSGEPPPVLMRLRANMWSYGPMWESNYQEYGQTFAATGSSVVMVVVRSAAAGVSLTCTIHDGGPSGPQIGPSKSATSVSGPSDIRFIWNGGEVPTVPGQIYYVKIRGNTSNAVFCNNEPIPDLSDAAPEGIAYHDGVPWSETYSTPDAGKLMDLGLTICSDDDGILTNMFTRSGGSSIAYATNVGQTFRARGTCLLSACAWIPDVNNTYVCTVYDGVGGAQVGTAKRSRVMRGADPEILWTWAQDECPLTPGQTYYMEVTMDGGGVIATVYANPYNPYPNGAAYKNRVLQTNMDLAGTIMEEESPGSATVPTVQFTSFPTVALADRGANSLTVRWTTDVASDSLVEYAAWAPPYTASYYDGTPTTNHVAVISGLQSNTMYHLRVRSAAGGRRTGVTRDFVAATINDTPNLLTNPGFEAPPGSSSPVKPVPGWTTTGLDWGESDGSWFWGIPPYAGNWLLEGAVNGSSANGYVYQTVAGVTPGKVYNFTVALTSWMRENDNWKYDVWYNSGRLSYMRIGIDPYGTNNPTSTTIHWTPYFYSHLRYTTAGFHDTAQNSSITVVMHFKGQGGQWHLFGVDDCRLSVAGVTYTPYQLSALKANANDGVNAEIADVIITASVGEANAYYVETADRSSGIKVVSSDLTVPAGRKVTVRGTLATDATTGERYLANATLISPVVQAEPQPLTMKCSSVGGAALGSKIPAVPGTFGPHNTGLLIGVAGQITVKDPNSKYVFINDGSLEDDGLKVDTSHISASLVPNVGAMAVFKGISSLYYSSGVKPMVIVRRAADVSFHNP